MAKKKIVEKGAKAVEKVGDFLYDLSNSQKTQIATTGGSYQKARSLLDQLGIGDDVLDYGAGRGHGTPILRGKSYEPFPNQWEPDFTGLTPPNQEFEGVVNLNVLNVLPPEQRAEVARGILNSIKKDGYGVVGARSFSDVMSGKTNELLPDGGVMTGRGTYQYGFGGQNEGLIEYLERIAKDIPDKEFDIKKNNIGAAGALINRVKGAAPVVGATGLGGAALMGSDDAEAGVIKSSIKLADDAITDSYRGGHQAPDADYGAPLHDLTEMIPEDIYGPQGQRYYGLGDPKVDREAFNVLREARGNPEMDVPVYRAVPKGVEDMYVGDWVTTSKEYAKMHGENALGGDYDILEATTKAKKLQSEGYPYEFGLLPASAAIALGLTGSDDVSAMTPQQAVDSGIGFSTYIQYQKAMDYLKKDLGEEIDTLPPPPPSQGSIEAAALPFMQTGANALRSVEFPWGRPFESTANAMDSWAYGENADMMDKGLGLLEVGSLGGLGLIKKPAKYALGGILATLGL